MPELQNPNEPNETKEVTPPTIKCYSSRPCSGDYWSCPEFNLASLNGTWTLNNLDTLTDRQLESLVWTPPHFTTSKNEYILPNQYEDTKLEILHILAGKEYDRRREYPNIPNSRTDKANKLNLPENWSIKIESA